MMTWAVKPNGHRQGQDKEGLFLVLLYWPVMWHFSSWNRHQGASAEIICNDAEWKKPKEEHHEIGGVIWRYWRNVLDAGTNQAMLQKRFAPKENRIGKTKEPLSFFMMVQYWFSPVLKNGLRFELS
jgi:hypothetical protein